MVSSIENDLLILQAAGCGVSAPLSVPERSSFETSVLFPGHGQLVL